MSEINYNFIVKTRNHGNGLKREIFFDKKSKLQIATLLIKQSDSPYHRLYVPTEKYENFVGWFKIKDAYDRINFYNTLIGKFYRKFEKNYVLS